MKNTIRNHKDFDFSDSKSAILPAFFMKKRQRKFDAAQYGIVAGKKVFPGAVQRNRAKRLLREWIRECKMPADQDILLVARTAILETDLRSGLAQMKKALKSNPEKQPKGEPEKTAGKQK